MTKDKQIQDEIIKEYKDELYNRGYDYLDLNSEYGFEKYIKKAVNKTLQEKEAEMIQEFEKIIDLFDGLEEYENEETIINFTLREKEILFYILNEMRFKLKAMQGGEGK